MESTTVGNAIRDVLPSLRDAEFVLFSLRPDDSLATALRKLQGYKITGAPVLEDYSPRALRSAFMIDLMDLALAVAESGGRPEVLAMPLRQLAQGRSTPGLPLIYDDAPLSEGVRALQSSGARRLLVLNQASDAPLGLLSQSSVVTWALRHLKHLPPDVLAKPVRELMGAASGVVTVRQSDPMAEALRQFVGESRSGVPVVDDGGRIVANLSLADLRRVTPESAVDLLRLSVDGFLRATQELPKDPVTCPPSTPLSAVLELLHKHHVHRIYVTDEQGRPVGVFSMTDAVASLCPPMAM